MDFKKELEVCLKACLKEDISLSIPNPDFGDFSLPCFELAKKCNKNPVDFANELKSKLKLPKFIEKIEVKGPYLNFFLKNNILIENVIKKILKEKNNYGKAKSKKFILIEHTSINPNASPHVGRGRNALIGDSLVRVFKFLGYKTEVHYWVNDVGKQIAMLVYGYKKKTSFKDLLKLYIKTNEEIQKHPEKEKDIFGILNKLEHGDKKVRAKFKEVVNICLKGQISILNDLGIKFDVFDYESKYLKNKELKNILARLEKTGKLFTDEENRKVLNQENNNLAMRNPVLVLTRGDGTSLYPLRDILYTHEKMRKGENIVVLGEDQKLYFNQIKIAMKMLGEEAPRQIHYSFILLKGKKMATREGNLVLMEDFMKEALEKADKEIKKRKVKDKKLAKIIGYGAIKYNILKISNDKEVLFDWGEALNFEGDSAPYIQYSYARACSILKKAKKINKANYKLLTKQSEINLIKILKDFPEIVLKVKEGLKPYLITNYTYDLAKSFNEFYRDCPCLKAENKLKNARLSLVLATKYTLKNALWLLGIEAPEKM